MSIPGAGDALLLASSGSSQYTVSRSLRFNSSDSAYLSRTPSSAGNRKTWTWSGWVKRSSLTTGYQTIFGAGNGLTSWGGIRINASPYHDKIQVFEYIGGWVYDLTTTAVFRDPSAWYHLIVAVDTTQATTSNRVKIYINGAQLTAFDVATYPAQNTDLFISSTNVHTIGTVPTPNTEYFSGYLAECYLIDGQQLTPSSFGETNATTGQWVPKAYTGSYGTNGFKLDFADNSAATAAALGKDTSGNNNHWSPVNLSINTGGPTSVAAASGALPIYNTTDTYGATKGTGTRTDANASSLVLAIPMDGANNGTTFTDESATIRGSGSAKTVTANGNAKTVTSQSKYYGSSGAFDGSGDFLSIAGTHDIIFGSSNFTIEGWIYPNNNTGGSILSNTDSWQAGRYNLTTGQDGTGKLYFFVNSIGGGSALLASSAGLTVSAWSHFAVVRSGSSWSMYINGIQASTYSSASSVGDSGSLTVRIGATDGGGAQNFNGNLQDLRVYVGVAKYTANFNPPSTTQNATVGAGCDSLVDTPVSSGTDTGAGGEVRGNYATLNPLSPTLSKTLANGNLDVTLAALTSARATIGVSSGKWYWEVTYVARNTGSGTPNMGVCFASNLKDAPQADSADAYTYYGNTGQKQNNGTLSSYGNTYTAGDVIGFALDLDNGRIFFSKNGTWQASGDPAAGTNAAFTGLSGTYIPLIAADGNGNYSLTANFGQRPFAYTAPSGFKALVDTNIPVVIAKPNTVFDTKLYTGNGSTQNITGLGFNPDLVWIKSRTNPDSGIFHTLVDAVRGQASGYYRALFSNSTDSEDAPGGVSSPGTVYGGVTAFNSDGFTLAAGSSDQFLNKNTTPYVAWMWDAGSSTVTNTQGSITSTVRANPSAGFSIAKFTPGGAGQVTVGHGLGAAPALIIVKPTSVSSNWYQWITGFNVSEYLTFTTSAKASSTNFWGTSLPSSAVFGFNAGGAFDHIAYCFAPVAGHSSAFTYTGNGSSSGPFVHLGFRPRFFFVKRTDAAGDWWMYDAARNPYNVTNYAVRANSSAAEVSDVGLDMLSNGFKYVNDIGAPNINGATYIGFAWAESPFQYARAR